jgi:hypothetical protein
LKVERRRQLHLLTQWNFRASRRVDFANDEDNFSCWPAMPISEPSIDTIFSHAGMGSFLRVKPLFVPTPQLCFTPVSR